MLFIKLQLTSWDCRPSFTYIYQGLKLESPKHRVVKIPVPGPFLHLNASPTAGPCQHSWVRKTTQSRASERKFQSRRKLEASAQKKAEIYLIEFPSVSTSEQKPLSKLQLNCARLGDCRRNFSPASSPHRARAVFSESLTPVISGEGAALSEVRLSANCAQEPQLSWRAGDARQTGLLLRAREPQLSRRAGDAPQMGLLLRARVSEC